MGPLVDERTLARLLDDVAAGTTPVADAVEALRTLPYETVTDARVDHHRELRTGHPEAIYGPGKTPRADPRHRRRRSPRARAAPCC